jgi:hypothetical protein
MDHTRFSWNFIELLFTQFEVRQAGSIGGAFDLYSGGTWCESRLGHRITLTAASPVFTQSFHTFAETVS